MDDRLDLRFGLGLLLVRQILAMHNGTLQMENNNGTGCKAIMNFPHY